MVRFMCCKCSLRTAVMIISGISLLHFIVESCAIYVLGEEHRLVLSEQTPFFYSMITLQVFMALLSILLFVGAYSRIFWFCIPWLLLTTLNLFYHLYIAIVLIIKMIVHFDATKLEMLMLVMVFMLALNYMAWTVGSYVLHLARKGKDDSDEENGEKFPLIDDDN